MMRGSADAIAPSGGRRFDGTLIVRAPAIRSARNDDDANLCWAVSLAGAARGGTERTDQRSRQDHDRNRDRSQHTARRKAKRGPPNDDLDATSRPLQQHKRHHRDHQGHDSYGNRLDLRQRVPKHGRGEDERGPMPQIP